MHSTSAGTMVGMIDALLEAGLPQSYASIGLIVLAVIGLALWTSGSRLMRSGVTLVGLVVGAVVGLAIWGPVLAGPVLIAGIALSAVAGAVFGALLMRAALAFSLALVMGVCTPLSVHAVTGKALPALDETAAAMTLDDPQAAGVAAGFMQVEAGVRHVRESAVAWWDGLDDAAHRTLLTLAAVGAIAGLAIGFMLPQTGAAIQSSLVGSLFLVHAGMGLAHIHTPGTFDPLAWGARPVVLAVCLITIGGVFLQWMLRRKKTDK